jgi:hypothetical protein
VAATKRLNHLDMNANQIQNVLAQLLASDPGSPAEGQFWYDTTNHVWKHRTNAATIILGRLDQISAPTASVAMNAQKITGLANATTGTDAMNQTSTLAIRLDQFAAPTSAVAFNAQRITGVADPTAAQDAATKAYVDAIASGLDPHESVRVASTANLAGITYTATGGASARGQITVAPNTLDGVSLAAGDRILLKDQTTGAQNGIYVVTTLGTGSNGVWDRATDFDQDTEAVGQPYTWVEEGTVNADTAWVMTNNGVVTVGGASGTAQVWAKFATTGATAGTVNKFSSLIGDGSTTSITVTDSLGSSDKVAQVRDASTNAVVECDIVMTSTTQTTFIFSVAPASNALRVVIVG